MLTKNSVFNARYFYYAIKKVLPYSVVMAIILFAASFIMSYFSLNVYSKIDGIELYYPITLGITANAMMYIMPVLLAVGLFGFLHKKNAIDFYGSVPIKRSALFLTNFAVAAVIMTATLLLNFILIAFIMFVVKTGTILIAPFAIFVEAFFYNLLGYLQIFAITAFAATLTGTPTAQLLIAFVSLILPSFFVGFFQFPFWNYSYFDMTTTVIYYSKSLTSYLALPDVASAPITYIYQMIMGDIAEFHGQFSMIMSLQGITFTIFVTGIYLILGVMFFNRYKAENADRPFVSERVMIYGLGGLLLPIMLLFFYAISDMGLGYALSEVVFYVLLLIIAIAYTVGCLILNKGFQNFGKSMLLFVIITVFSLPTSAILHELGDDNTHKHNFSFRDEIKQITVYLKPINLESNVSYVLSNENVKNSYKKVTIKDAEILKALSQAKTGLYSEREFYYEITLENGKKITLSTQLPVAFIDALENYIDSNDNLKKSLFKAEGLNGFAGATILFDGSYAYYENKYATPFKEKDEILKLIAEYELSLVTNPISLSLGTSNYVLIDTAINETPSPIIATDSANQITDKEVEYMKYYLGGYYTSTTDTFGLLENNSATLSVNVYKYVDGQYYKNTFALSVNTDKFENIVKEIHKKALDGISWDSILTVNIIGAMNLDEEQYLNISGIVSSMAKTIPSEFLEMLKTAVKSPISKENTLVLSINASTIKGNKLVILDIERDIVPLFEEYLNASLNNISNEYYDFYFSNSLLLNGDAEAGGTIFFPSTKTTDTSSILKKQTIVTELLSKRDTLKDLMHKKYTKDNIPDEVYFICLSNHPYYRNYAYATCSQFMIDESFTEILSPLFDYYQKVDYYLNGENIVGISAAGENVSKDNDFVIEVIIPYIKYHFFKEFNVSLNFTNESYGTMERYENENYIQIHYENGVTVDAIIPMTEQIYKSLFEENGGA